MTSRHFIQWCLLLFFLSGIVHAAPTFPPLTGRVVDDAHVLSTATISSLDNLLADYENGTTNQVVVVTLPTLQGYPIEDFGYQLGRYWQIGQKDKNNGVLLIVAPKEHKVRIEVGYGLEPILTDAISSTIIQAIILPDIKAGHLEQGVIDGTQAIVDVLGGKGLSLQHTNQSKPLPLWVVIIFLGFFLWFAIRHPFFAAIILNSGSSGSGGGGGFSGGGGSFGGGGASGSW